VIGPGSHPRQSGKTLALAAEQAAATLREFVAGVTAGAEHTPEQHAAMAHTAAIVPGPKMDTPGLVKAQCSCGGYTTSSGTERMVLRSHADHATAKIAALVKGELPCVRCPAVVLEAFAVRRAAAEAAGGSVTE
jgi:hypothetical protein